jgi:excisionase family DNA binding protein
MLTTKDISEMLHVSEETVRRWIRNDELKAIQDGKMYTVEQAEYERFVKEKTSKPGTSLSKMHSVLSGIMANPKTKDIATQLLNKSIGKIVPNSDVTITNSQASSAIIDLLTNTPDNLLYTNDEINAPVLTVEELKYQIDSLKRKKKKLELEYQLKCLEIEEKIAKFEKIMK